MSDFLLTFGSYHRKQEQIVLLFPALSVRSGIDVKIIFNHLHHHHPQEEKKIRF